MSQGLFVAAGGIKACQQKIDVVSDNIANMNTVGFKSSQVTFENVFSRTLSSGSSPSTNVGGSNPTQIGLGVTISGITRNFTGGTIQSTGKSSDLNISGNGFFTVQNTDGTTYLTRAGNFTLGSDGSLSTPKGLRVLGTSEINGTESNVTIKIPQSLCIQKALISTDQSNTITNALNSTGTKISAGTFSLVMSGTPTGTDLVTTGGSSTAAITTGTLTMTVAGSNKSIDITSADTMNSIASKIQTALGGTGTATYSGGTFTITPNGTDQVSFGGTSNFATIAGLPTTSTTGAITSNALVIAPKTITITSGETVQAVLNDIKTKLGSGSSASVGADGTITIAPPSSHTLSFAGLDTDTSNFLSVANFNSSGTSTVLRDASQATIGVGDSTSNTTALSSWSVGSSGEIEATYENGDKLTVTTAPNDSNRRVLKLTSSGIDIIDPTVVGSAVIPAELQIQMANVVNPNGLVSKGGNMFQVAPNSGSAIYSIGSAGGIGMVQSGGLESSNVDLTSEFADMMLAQRGIDANSRTFSAQNQIMTTIVNLGRG